MENDRRGYRWLLGFVCAALVFVAVALVWKSRMGPDFKPWRITALIAATAVGIVFLEVLRRIRPWLMYVGAVGLAAFFFIGARVLPAPILESFSSGDARPIAAAELMGPGLTPAPDLGLEPAPADDLLGALEAVALYEDLEQPVDMAFTADGRMLVASRLGTVTQVALGGSGERTLVHDISAQLSTRNEQGLLGIAVSPTGRLYLHYTGSDGDNRVTSWAMDGTTIVPNSRRDVLQVRQVVSIHNGGGLRFGLDGTLYISIGDGGPLGDPYRAGQDRDNRLGAILRVVPDEERGGYLIPPDNPYIDDRGWPEIYAYGVRNPFRISIDPLTGDLWMGDVGSQNFEEVNFVAAGDPDGANFGWSLKDGGEIHRGFQNKPRDTTENDLPDDLVDAVFAYPHDKSVVADDPNGGHGWRNSVTGGVRYRGDAIDGLYGVYVFGDFVTNQIRGLIVDDGDDPYTVDIVDDLIFDVEVPAPVAFAEGPDGSIYVLSIIGGLYQLS